ncbi:endonuclease-reverse transcriptase domain-containing protein [Phthorimaea operculella]|nr:endonuclease-reverse transcriptase domain-containing protein [Phthorimaea operculella]
MCYEAYLNKVEAIVRNYLPRPVLVLGDFNARSRVWGDMEDTIKGDTLLEWAAGLDLRLLNRGSTSTCVRWQGESIVDLSWASQLAERMVSDWRVAEEIVSLSDHRHIVFTVVHRQSDGAIHRRTVISPGWALNRLNKDLLVAAAHTADWHPAPSWENPSIPEGESLWLRETMTSVCDAAMPRVKQNIKFPVYWWSEHIAHLRETCLAARRVFTRTRRRRIVTEEEKASTYAVYRTATVALQTAIADAKCQSWNELLSLSLFVWDTKSFNDPMNPGVRVFQPPTASNRPLTWLCNDHHHRQQPGPTA